MWREPDIHVEFPKRFEIEILEGLRPRPRYEGDDLRLSGFDAPANDSREFTVDLRTGQATDKPYS
jgi:hypothetical protein